MPLAFTQEDFLVGYIFIISPKLSNIEPSLFPLEYKPSRIYFKSLRWGRQPTILANISRKLHELDPEGRGAFRAPFWNRHCQVLLLNFQHQSVYQQLKKILLLLLLKLFSSPNLFYCLRYRTAFNRGQKYCLEPTGILFTKVSGCFDNLFQMVVLTIPSNKSEISNTK